jgi:hypothetical protein
VVIYDNSFLQALSYISRPFSVKLLIHNVGDGRKNSGRVNLHNL